MGSERTPLVAAARMARASECRNSHLYYYGIKFALSTYATLFSVGAPVAFLSFLVFPHPLPALYHPAGLDLTFQDPNLPLPKRQILAGKRGAAKPLVLAASRVQNGQSWAKRWVSVDLGASPFPQSRSCKSLEAASCRLGHKQGNVMFLRHEEPSGGVATRIPSAPFAFTSFRRVKARKQDVAWRVF